MQYLPGPSIWLDSRSAHQSLLFNLHKYPRTNSAFTQRTTSFAYGCGNVECCPLPVIPFKVVGCFRVKTHSQVTRWLGQVSDYTCKLLERQFNGHGIHYILMTGPCIWSFPKQHALYVKSNVRGFRLLVVVNGLVELNHWMTIIEYDCNFMWCFSADLKRITTEHYTVLRFSD